MRQEDRHVMVMVRARFQAYGDVVRLIRLAALRLFLRAGDVLVVRDATVLVLLEEEVVIGCMQLVVLAHV